MKKKVNESASDLISALGGAYDFATNIGNPLSGTLERRKTGFSPEQQRAYEIFRKNFIADIADLIDYGMSKDKFTLDSPSMAGSNIATARSSPGSRTVSYPDEFKGSRTWTNTKDWLQAYRDELEAIANKQPDIPLDTPFKSGQVSPAPSRTAQEPEQAPLPDTSEPVTFGGIKYYKVKGKWVNSKGKLADKNTSDLLDKVPLDESYPVKATVNGVTYTYSKNGWYGDSYKAEGKLLDFLNESYRAALLEAINYKKLQKKYTELLESAGIPTLGEFLYHNLIKKHVESNDLPPAIKLEIENILNNLNNSVIAKNKAQVTSDIEKIAYLIFSNSFNLLPRLMRKS